MEFIIACALLVLYMALYLLLWCAAFVLAAYVVGLIGALCSHISEHGIKDAVVHAGDTLLAGHRGGATWVKTIPAALAPSLAVPSPTLRAVA